MKAQTLLNVAPIFVAPTSNMFHHNNVGITYVGTSNFRVEPVRSIPLYFVTMPHSMVIVIEALFTITPAHTIVGMRFKPQTPRGINLVSMHIEMPRGLDKIFAKQPLDPGGGGSRPPRLLGYFGLPMVNPSKPPLPLNRPYYRPLNCPEYVKDFDLDVHVKLRLPLE